MAKWTMATIAGLVTALFILVRFCWLPERDERIRLEIKLEESSQIIKQKDKQIGDYNETAKNTSCAIKDFKAAVKTDDDYLHWADTPVPNVVLEFLQSCSASSGKKPNSPNV